MVLLCAGRVEAWSYHSFNQGYSLAIPEDWTQIPEEVLTVRAPGLAVLRSGKGTFDCAFQPRRAEHYFEYPYILVEVIPYGNLGFQQQVDDSEIQMVVKSNTGLDPANPYTADTQVMEGGGELETLDGVLNFDREGRRFTWSATSTLEGIGLVRTRQWGFFGKDSLIQITLYERGRGSDRLRDMARSVAASFKYETGKEYQPAFGFDQVYKLVRQFFSAPTMTVVVTIGCVGTAVLFAIVALVSSRRNKVSGYGEFGEG